MRTLSAMIAALALGACAAQPRGPAQADMAAQVRSQPDAGKYGCAGLFSTDPEQNHIAQAKCLNANPLAQSKPNVQTAQMQTKQPIVNAHPIVFNTVERAPPPRLDGPRESFAAAAGVPALDAEASCYPTERLAVDQNVARCLSVESSAHDELVHKWTEFPSADRSHCVRYTTAGGGGTYTDLLTCLEMDLDARNLDTKNKSVADR